MIELITPDKAHIYGEIIKVDLTTGRKTTMDLYLPMLIKDSIHKPFYLQQIFLNKPTLLNIIDFSIFIKQFENFWP